MTGCSDNDYTWSDTLDKSESYTLCSNGCDYEFDCFNDDSMKPTFSCQNTLYLSRPEKNEIREGDIIHFFTSHKEGYPDLTVHRVVDITSKGYKTQGDNNNYEDSFVVSYSSVLGKVWRIDG